MTNCKTAIIDIGSNSIRVVIYEQTASEGYRVIDSSKISARLGEQLDKDNRLNEEAIAHLITSLKHFMNICKQHQVSHIKAAATAALRKAVNREDILLRIQREVRLPIELLTGDEEAYYGFIGMIESMSISNGFLIDIGGGSTELSLFKNRQLLHSISIPIGCLSAPLGDMQAYTAEELLRSPLFAQLSNLLASYRWIEEKPGLELVGLGGTIRTMANIHQAKTKYCFRTIHNYSIDIGQVKLLFEELSNLTLEQRKLVAGLSKDRADVITKGLGILLSIAQIIDCRKIRLCSTGLRDGLYFTHYRSKASKGNPLKNSIENICALYSSESAAYRKQIRSLSLYLFDVMQSSESMASLSAEGRKLLEAAAPLYRIGMFIDFDYYSEHTFYLLIHAKLYGLTHREHVLTAAIASFKSKGAAKQQLEKYRSILHDNDLRDVLQLGSLLRLAAALDRSRKQAIKRLKASINRQQLKLHMTASTSTELEQFEIKQLSQEFKKVWGIQLTIESSINPN